MDFEAAERRLAQDQSRLRSREKSRGSTALSSKAKKEAEYRRKQQEKRRVELAARHRKEELAQDYITSCNRALGVKGLSRAAAASDEGGVGSDVGGVLHLQPTSIFGEGDKIALPPSVLKFLTEKDGNVMTSGQPLAFRVGLRNPDYTFPASVALQEKINKAAATAAAEDNDGNSGTFHEEDYNEDDDDEADTKAYLDELSHKYLSYTYATVVEFTQEEGHVGLPAPIASALLYRQDYHDENASPVVPVTRTVDPASAASNEGDEHMQTDEEDEKTPGHLAWGAFDVPACEVEITLLELPKGRGCTLIPTAHAIRHGFYSLKDVKLVLEQSLIRTRATLSVGDVVHTWHRGTKFDLRVAAVTPPDFDAISCINTDIEVDIGAAESQDTTDTTVLAANETDLSFAPGVGHKLSEASAPAAPVPMETSSASKLSSSVSLPPEPPLEQRQNVCTVQIRGDTATGRRRFDVTLAKMSDLFAFAGSVCGTNDSFQLVTRFPRRVFVLGDCASQTLAEAGINAGQELFMVERLN